MISCFAKDSSLLVAKSYPSGIVQSSPYLKTADSPSGPSFVTVSEPYSSPYSPTKLTTNVATAVSFSFLERFFVSVTVFCGTELSNWVFSSLSFFSSEDSSFVFSIFSSVSVVSSSTGTSSVSVSSSVSSAGSSSASSDAPEGSSVSAGASSSLSVSSSVFSSTGVSSSSVSTVSSSSPVTSSSESDSSISSVDSSSSASSVSVSSTVSSTVSVSSSSTFFSSSAVFSSKLSSRVAICVFAIATDILLERRAPTVIAVITLTPSFFLYISFPPFSLFANAFDVVRHFRKHQIIYLVFVYNFRKIPNIYISYYSIIFNIVNFN